MKTKQKKIEELVKLQRETIDATILNALEDIVPRLSSLEEKVEKINDWLENTGKPEEEKKSNNFCTCNPRFGSIFANPKGVWCEDCGKPIHPTEDIRSEIRTMLFVHPLWNGKHKDTNELADKIIALIKE